MTSIRATVTPPPAPTQGECGGEPDPFGPLPVECAPPAPDWLFPVTMSLLGVVTVMAVVGVALWVARVRRDKAAMRERLREREWVDLGEFNPRKDHRRQRSPKVVRDEATERGRDDGQESS